MDIAAEQHPPVLEAGKLVVYLGEAVDVETLTHFVNSNRIGIHTVEIRSVCGGGEPDWGSEQVLALIMAISCLPQLKNVYLNALGLYGDEDDDLFPLSVLTLLLQAASTNRCSLQSLKMDNVNFTTTAEAKDSAARDQEYSAFMSALQQQKHLQTFSATECRFSDWLLERGLSEVVAGLASLPQLKDMTIQADDTGYLGSLDDDCVEQLCQCKALESVYLGPFSELDVAHLSQCVLASSSLTEFILDTSETPITRRDAMGLSEMVQNHPALTKLVLYLPETRTDGDEDEEDDEEDLDEVARLPEFLQGMAQALGKSASTQLKELRIDASDNETIDDEVEEAFATTLEATGKGTCQLEVLSLSGYKGPARARIDFCLHLNQVGIRKLWVGAGTNMAAPSYVSPQEWLQVMERVLQADKEQEEEQQAERACFTLSCLYHVLRLEPSFVFADDTGSRMGLTAPSRGTLLEKRNRGEIDG